MLGLSLTLLVLAPLDFGADQRQAAMDYVPARQKLSAFLGVGDLEGYEKLFLATVPEEKRTPAHYLMLGDTFFATDPEFSRRQHAKAFELLPDAPPVAQAWATQLHRSGQCAEAEALYARLSNPRADWTSGVQRIDCLVRLGRLAEALEAWRANSGSPMLSKAFFVVPERIAAGDTREHRRLSMRKAIAAGQTESVEDLVFLDLMRPGGQRRFEVERFELDVDRKLIQEHLDPASRRARELWAVCDFWCALWERNFPPAAAGDFAAKFGERLRELGWLDSGGDLPAHPLVARWAVTALLEGGLRKSDELLADWERALAARLEEGDAGAGHALLELQRDVGSPQIRETEQLLWSRAHDAEAARVLLERRGERLESGDPLLREALERCPGDARLCELAAECARREGKGEREALARTISACFQPPGDFARAQSAFERLEQLLASDERR